MKLAVIIPALNEESVIAQQLEALLEQECDAEWEVIVVDNGSTDHTAEIVGEQTAAHHRLRLVGAAERADQSYAANAGVAATDADAFVFCDADDIVADGWVAAVAKGLQLHDVVTGPLELDRLNPPWLATSRGRSVEDPVGSFEGLFPCVRGNNYGITRDAWSVLGPLREDMFPVADIDFSLRAWRAGITIAGLPDAVVHYRYRDAPRDLWRQGWAYGRSRPKIVRAMRDHGEPRPDPLSGWRSWAVVVATAPLVFRRHDRARWLWVVANRLGQVAGSIRHGVLYL